jgi:tRNA threonylcarbamoyladenosine biosynthesis protein TsaB
MKVLAIDTSNQPMSIALAEDNTLKATTTLNTVLNHSIYVLPTIDTLFQRADWQPADIDRIVVAKGPGSYTGIRIAVTTAKTLAMTLQKELVGVSSLQVLASNVPPVSDQLIVPFMDARRGNVFAGIYRYEDQQLKTVVADQHMAFGELLQLINKQGQPAWLVGQMTKRVNRQGLALPDQIQLLPASYAFPSTYRLALMGEQMPPVKDIDNFVPDYLRLTQAERDWQKEHPEAKPQNYVEEV